MITKDYIIEQFTGDIELQQYLPDTLNKATVTRSFLLALLFNIKKEKYFLYNIYKTHLANREYGNGKVYGIKITNDYAKNIVQFINTTK